jgi:hypothetical protein
MPQLAHALRTGSALLLGALVLAACGRGDQREAEAAAAPVRHVVDRLSTHPNWLKQPAKCLCVGLFRGEDVVDFPAGSLDDEFARHRWLRNWSECAPMYGRKHGLADCRGGMTDYICSVADQAGLPPGTVRVMCHVNGENELLLDEYDVSGSEGALSVRPVSQKATSKLHER